jgi:hypothetical protein
VHEIEIVADRFSESRVFFTGDEPPVKNTLALWGMME